MQLNMTKLDFSERRIRLNLLLWLVVKIFRKCQAHIFENLTSDSGCLYVHLILIDEDSTGSSGETPDRSHDAVVFEKVLSLDKCQTKFLVELRNRLIVPVVADVAETTSENDVPVFLARTHESFKEALVHIVTVYDAGADDEVEVIVPAWRKIRYFVDVVFDQIVVDFF